MKGRHGEKILLQKLVLIERRIFFLIKVFFGTLGIGGNSMILSISYLIQRKYLYLIDEGEKCETSISNV